MAAKKAKSKGAFKGPKVKAVSAAKPATARENLRKLFLAGLGLADETSTKFQQTFNTLVKKGQAKEPQVKKAVGEIRKKALARRKELEKKFLTYLRENELRASREIGEIRKNWEKKFSDFVRQNKLLKSREIQELRKNWEKKLSEKARQSELLKSKEIQALRKRVESLQAKAKEWESRAKEAAKRALATPIAKEPVKTSSAPEPVAQEPVETPPPATQEVSVSTEVEEQTTTRE